MSERALKNMMVKFEITLQLGVLPGRKRKRIDTTVEEHIASAVVEASSESPNGTYSVPTISRTLDMPCSTVRHMRKILNFYMYKIHAVQQKPQNLDTRKIFELEFHVRMAVDDSWPWDLLLMNKAHLHLNRQVNSHNYRIWLTEIPHAVHVTALHNTTWTVWCRGSLLHSFSGHIFLYN
ncbi:uncharacterized protein TNCV_2690561 [Trichonephila clavipes]|uniref:Uncharacterized protein n=1 Tax=Trichonephila clavipes TaxID=2585209 RepID=A0A8X6VYN2_TRICX|nr:uncharacterized protein TNCV_2690561 [Trichonephila clavipes]